MKPLEAATCPPHALHDGSQIRLLALCAEFLRSPLGLCRPLWLLLLHCMQLNDLLLHTTMNGYLNIPAFKLSPEIDALHIIALPCTFSYITIDNVYSSPSHHLLCDAHPVFQAITTRAMTAFRAVVEQHLGEVNCSKRRCGILQWDASRAGDVVIG